MSNLSDRKKKERRVRQALILKGALDVFKEKGKHARSVVGVNSLPLNAAVELETVFEI